MSASSIYGQSDGETSQTLPTSDDEDSRMGESDERVNSDTSDVARTDYDRSLPTTHSYLGEQGVVERDNLYSEGSVIDLPVLVLQDVVVFPGSTVPLRLLDGYEIDQLNSLLRRNVHTMGVLCLTTGEGDGPWISSIGTIVDIRFIHSTGETSATTTGRDTGLSVTCVGRQRFRMNSAPHVHLDIASVCVLPSDTACTRVPAVPAWAFNQVAGARAQLRDSSVQDRELENAIAANMWFRGMAGGGTRARQSYTELVSLPKWLYPFRDEQFWVTRVVHAARVAGFPANTSLTRESEVDITHETYRLCSSIPSSSHFRATLLSLDSSLGRLIALYENLCQRNAYAKCVYCGVSIARVGDVFDMNAAGTVQAYVNPHGVVHETLTVKCILRQNVLLSGRPCEQDSWFPQYAWTILNCAECYHHLGWRFTATTQLNPKEFWGLRRASVMF